MFDGSADSADDFTEGMARDADVVVTGPDRREEALAARAPETVWASLHPLGAPVGDPPSGMSDYAAEVRGYGDRFVPYAPVDPSAPALVLGEQEFSGAYLVEQARAAGARWELTAADRVLSAVGFHTLDGVLVSLLAPLATGASVVFCPNNPSRGALTRWVRTERITALAGIVASGLDRRNLEIASNTP